MEQINETIELDQTAGKTAVKKKVEVKNLSKLYLGKKNYFEAVSDVSFDIREGEFLVLLGPGRCGKTVLLNIIAGIEEKSGGSVIYNGQEIKGPNPEFSMVFQKRAILPFKTVMENVELGLKFKGMPKKERRAISQKYIDLVGLQGFENAYPSALSGGMKQRVGIARAYAMNPQLLIMDEPFGALDAQTRYAMQNEILRIWEQEKRTVLFVTNNLEEAVYLGNRIILLSKAPAIVKAEYEVELPRPRNMTGPEFMDLRMRISDNTDLSI
ncbi:MAG: ABC transporter ATP-binding protein [Lachnospiraceae bacterium]|jgi:ABC-type nitrate/sulfonate/bicarbonate transport system ATPase subunit|nr:ABC transporter ATP-binding protein [Lachnospiraceae bacterium]